jgi:hypothetical protein
MACSFFLKVNCAAGQRPRRRQTPPFPTMLGIAVDGTFDLNQGSGTLPRLRRTARFVERPLQICPADVALEIM